MTYFQIKLTEKVIENIKKICKNYDILIDEFFNDKYENHKILHNRLIDDLEHFLRKNYTDRLKIKNCLIDLQNFHNILCDIAVASQKYNQFINKNDLNDSNNLNEIKFSYRYDNLFIK